MKRNVCLLAFVLVGVVISFGCTQEDSDTSKKIVPSTPKKGPEKCAKSCCPSETAPAVKAKPAEKAKSCCSDGKPGSPCCAKPDPKKAEAAPEDQPKPAMPGMPEMPKMPGGVTLQEFFKSLKLPEVVATVGDDKITKEDVFKEIETQIPKFMRDNPLPPQAVAQLSSNISLIVDSMVSRQLLVGLAAKDGIKPSAEMITAKFDEFVKNMPPDQKKMFEAQLKSQGSSIAERRKEAAADVNSQSAMAIDQWINEKIMPEIKVDDAVVEKYYRENQEQFKKPETIKVAHILITPQRGTPELAEKTDEEKKAFAENADAKAQKEASAILDQLKQGGDFAKLAKDKSACPSKNEGGVLPEFDKKGVMPGKGGAMDSTFTAASYKLKPGGISELVKTPFGYHIIKCIDSSKESYIPMKQVEPFLKESLKKEELGKKVKTLIDAEKEKQKVVMHIDTKPATEEK